MKKIIVSLALTFAVALVANAESPTAEKAKTLKVGDTAPAFKIKNTSGKEIDLAKLTRPRGRCWYASPAVASAATASCRTFQALHEAYKKDGIRLVAIFAEPDEKFAKYAKSKQFKMQYALDPKRNSWKTFGTKTMPSNFLIGKGGKVIAISKGCDPSGLIARNLGDKTATLLKAEKVDIKTQVDKNREAGCPEGSRELITHRRRGNSAHFF